MLTDSKKIKTQKSVKKRLPTDKRKWYSDSQKLEAVKCWLITGNLVQTAAALNIGFPTIRLWRYSAWWDDLVKEIRTENSIQLSGRLKQIAKKAMDVTEDRLENGDWILNQKTGEMQRKQVNMKDAARVASDLLDKADKLDKKPQEQLGNEKMMDTLAKLAAKFEEFANKKNIVHVTDVMFADEIQNENMQQVLTDEESDEFQQEDDEREDGSTAEV